MKWLRQDRRYLPIHDEISSGEHDKHGEFRLVRAMATGTIWISLKVPLPDGGTETRLYTSESLTPDALMNSFFDFLEEEGDDDDVQ